MSFYINTIKSKIKRLFASKSDIMEKQLHNLKKARRSVRRSIGFLAIAIIFTLASNGLNAQDVKAPSLLFQYTCPQANFNNFEVGIEIDPTAFAPENVFFLELSDADGDFSSPIVLNVIEGKNGEQFFYSGFGFDESVYGDNYKIRVRSTLPESISAPSVGFEAHYIKSTYIVLNNYQDVKLCGGNSTSSISVDADPTAIYHWYKDGVFYAQGGADLTITEEGLYYVETYLGACTGLNYSNVITVTMGAELAAVSISPSEEVTIKEGETQVFVAQGAESYVWTDDNGNIVSNGATLNASKAGVYNMTATNGTCEETRSVTVNVEASPIVDIASYDVATVPTARTSEGNVVPSFISPNGDNINDTWVLPSEYANDPTVQVTIFTASGRQVFSTANYQNDWSGGSNLTSSGFNTVLYYMISKDGKPLKKGSITMGI